MAMRVMYRSVLHCVFSFMIIKPPGSQCVCLFLAWEIKGRAASLLGRSESFLMVLSTAEETQHSAKETKLKWKQ